MKTILIFLAALIFPFTLLPEEPQHPPFDDRAMQRGATFKDIKKQFQSFFNEGVIEFDKNYRFILNNGFEIDVGLGLVDEEKAVFTVFDFDLYENEESIDDARQNNHAMEDSEEIDKIWFSKDFTEMRLIIDIQDPINNLVINFRNPFNGTNMTLDNVVEVRIETHDPEADVAGKPIRVAEFNEVKTTFKGKDAEDLKSVLQSVERYKQDPNDEVDNEGELIIGGFPELGALYKNQFGLRAKLPSEFKEIDEILQSDDPAVLEKLNIDVLEMDLEQGTKKAIDFLRGQGFTDEDINKLAKMSETVIESVKMYKQVVATISNSFPHPELIYRRALTVSEVNERGKKTLVANFLPYNQLEVHFVLRGLKALGLRNDHPIFSYADKDFFNNGGFCSVLF